MNKSNFHHGNLKEELIKHSFKFIEQNDIEKLTLKVLSDATGTSRSAIYKHFSSKDKLIETIIISGFDKFDKILAPLLENKNEPLVDRFYKAGFEYINFAKTNPNLYRLLFGHKYHKLRDELISINDEDCSGFAALKKAVIEGQNSLILKKESAMTRTILIWSALHGVSSLIIDGFMDIDKDIDKIYEELFNSMLDSTLETKVKLASKLPFIGSLIKHK